MLNPDVLSAAIKEQQSAEDTGSYGRLKRDQNIWNPDGKISSDQNSHTLGEKTFQRAYSDIKVAKGNATEEAVCYSLNTEKNRSGKKHLYQIGYHSNPCKSKYSDRGYLYKRRRVYGC
mgnify:CR=1 FL=1